MNRNIVCYRKVHCTFSLPAPYCRSQSKCIYPLKAVLLLVLFCCFLAGPKVAAQTINLNLKNVPLATALEQISKQTQYDFSYNDKILKSAQPVTITLRNESLERSLQLLFAGQPLSYEISDRIIIIKEKKAPTPSSQPLPAQRNAPVRGLVVNEKQEPLYGVSIQVKGASQGTTTDKQGRFAVSAPSENTVLVFSYLGFVPREVPVSEKEEMTIVLKEQNNNMNEVVVVGYGTTLRKNLTTAIATVKTDNISKAAVSNMSQMLLGRAAGLQATLSSPQPGGDVNLSIRGGDTPIFIVDGVMMPAGSLEVGSGTTDVPNSIRRGGLAGLNPNDIASIEILKDASAAIYGIDAANGVVMITTKQGTESAPKIAYDGSYSVARNYPYLKQLNAQDYMNVANVFSKENYLFTRDMYPYGTNLFDGNWIPQFSPQQIAAASTTSWLDFVLKDGSINNQNITVTGGSKLLKYYMSGNYYDQEGTVVNSGMKRYTLRSNVAAQLLPFLKLTAIANINQNNYTNSSAEGGSGGHGSGSLQSALTYPSYLPVKDANGAPTIYQNFPNPADMVKVSDLTKSNGYYLNFATDVDLVRNLLKARLIYGLNKENANRNLYIPSDIYFFQMYKSRGHLGYTERQNQTMEATLTFNKKIKDLITIDAVAGVGKYRNNAQGMDVDYQQINDYIAGDRIEAAEGAYFPTSNRSENERRSQFMRASVDLFNKYIIAGTLRRDGTDKFFPGKKYGLFPSVSLGWKVSDEKFLQNVSWINQLKLRASWGQTGSDNLGSALYGTFSVASQYIKFSNNTVTYIPYLLSGPDYPDVTWQKTTMKNIGLDFSLFGNRIWGSFDMFRNDVTDLLGYDPASPLSATSVVPMNYGHFMRVGWDAAINSRNIKSASGFEWKSLLTLSHYNAVWIQREPNHYYEEYRARFYEPMNAIYYYETAGIINLDRSNMPASQQSLSPDAQKPGYPIIKDQNGDNQITVDDIKLRNTLPKINLGLGNTFAYKNIDLDVFLYGQSGQWKRNYAYSWASVGDLYYTGPKNTNQYAFEIWNSQTNPNGSRRGIASTKAVPLPGDVGYIDDFQDASFVRVRNITLGYNIAGTRLSRLGKYIQHIRVYVDCQNPFTFTNFVGVDPEAETGGYYTGYNSISAAEYPMIRTFSFGTMIRF